MALRFSCDAPVGDAELVISLDLDGVAALLKAMGEAVEAGRDQLQSGPAAAPEGETAEPLNAFDRVTFKFFRSPAPGPTD